MPEQHIYQYNLSDDDPKSSQPNKIKVALKPHQLTSLHKAIQLEQAKSIKTELNDVIYESKTNIGIIGDIVGYGKTIIALSIIAECNLDDIYENNEVTQTVGKTNAVYSGSISVKYDKTEKNLDVDNEIENALIKTTLIVVPRGPVYNQWKNMIEKFTTLKCLTLDNKRTLDNVIPRTNYTDIKNFFEQYDAILIKDTTLKVMNSEYMFTYTKYNQLNMFYRVILDEAHIIKTTDFHYKFLWLVTNSYNEYNRHISDVFHQLLKRNIYFTLVKNKREYIENSFELPIPIEKHYLCKINKQFSILTMYVNNSVRNRINVNDISGAIQELGGTQETEECLVNSVKNDFLRNIKNKEKELAYIQSLEIEQALKDNRIKNIKQELDRLNERLESMLERIQDISEKTCPVCLENVEDPIYLGCSHILCGRCLFKIVENKVATRMNNTRHSILCPECRTPITNNSIKAIVNNKSNDTDAKKVFTKEEWLYKIISEKPEGKFLIFSNLDTSFINVCDVLLNNNISFTEIKGNTGRMIKILENFKNGTLRVILLNTTHAGCGIDISMATDVIMYNDMPIERHQAIGRAQRVGRTEPLTIHHLCYPHELDTNEN